MREVDCQKLLVAAVSEDHAGMGLKLDNPFVKGPSDTILKLVGSEPFWCEVKLHRRVATSTRPNWPLDVTQLQKNFLRDWDYAGMLASVGSFVIEKDGDVRSLRFALYTYRQMEKAAWSASWADHQELGEKWERNANIRDVVRSFVNGDKR